jgi:dihydropteroate synthase
MGIINVTPDSFSDGNLFLELPEAVERAKQLIDDGADILDIGGESSRPGSGTISADEELQRVIPVLSELRKISNIPVSIDTRKARVAAVSIEAGADIINDISAGSFDSDMLGVLAGKPDIGYVMMHMQGEPATMQENPFYNDVISEICGFFQKKLALFEQAGICSNRIFLDPGIGFGKTVTHNLVILNHLNKFKPLGLPLVVGASRKRFIGEISPSSAMERTAGSLAAALVAADSGVAVIRTHDVKEHRQFFRILHSIREA